MLKLSTALDLLEYAGHSIFKECHTLAKAALPYSELYNITFAQNGGHTAYELRKVINSLNIPDNAKIVELLSGNAFESQLLKSYYDVCRKGFTFDAMDINLAYFEHLPGINYIQQDCVSYGIDTALCLKYDFAFIGGANSSICSACMSLDDLRKLRDFLMFILKPEAVAVVSFIDLKNWSGDNFDTDFSVSTMSKRIEFHPTLAGKYVRVGTITVYKPEEDAWYYYYHALVGSKPIMNKADVELYLYNTVDFKAKSFSFSTVKDIFEENNNNFKFVKPDFLEFDTDCVCFQKK